MRREWWRFGSRIVAWVTIAVALLVVAGAASARAAFAPAAVVDAHAATLVAAPGVVGGGIAGAVPPGYALEQFKWVDRTTVDVYYNWDGGTCVLGTTDLSGPASATSTAVALQSLDASIQAINVALRGGLTLLNAGPTTRAELCSQDPARAIVVGFGQIAQTGLTFSYGVSSASRPGWSNFKEARVFLNNGYDFACPGAPPYRDLQHTMTHELLHAIGLGHSTDPTALMAPTGIACSTPYLIQPDDLAGLAALYPPPASAVPAPGVGVVATFDRALSAVGVNPAVWNGGTVDQLAAATQAFGGVSVTVYAGGEPLVLIPGAPAFVNAAFTTAFPSEVPAGTIVLVVT